MADCEIETAAAVIEDLLYLLPPNKRAAALASVAQSEDRARADREKYGLFRVISAEELCASWGPQEERLWQDVMQFKARLIYVFIRDVINNNSPKRADKLLFKEHFDVPGSGRLVDYLDRLPAAAK